MTKEPEERSQNSRVLTAAQQHMLEGDLTQLDREELLALVHALAAERQTLRTATTVNLVAQGTPALQVQAPPGTQSAAAPIRLLPQVTSLSRDMLVNSVPALLAVVAGLIFLPSAFERERALARPILSLEYAFLMPDNRDPSEANAVRMRISILNKGATDGLVRHHGEVEYRGTTYPLRRGSPPSSDSTNAVPVFQTNEPDEGIALQSVGKVESDSMAEFWFEFSPANRTGGDASRICELAERIRITLYDHDRQPISGQLECNQEEA